MDDGTLGISSLNNSTKKKRRKRPPRCAAEVSSMSRVKLIGPGRFYAVAVKVPEPETLTPPPKAVDGKLQVPFRTLPVDVGAP